LGKTIVLVGTLDTKGIEFGYVKEKIVEQGHQVIVVDVGVLGRPLIEPDFTHEQVAQAAGTTIEDIISQGKEGVAIELMAEGAIKIVGELYRSGKVDGIMSLGGSMGTASATAVMRSLPIGIPKVMVSTMASSDTRPYVENKDIVMIPSVADIMGLNPIAERVLATAAGAVAGMVTADPGLASSDKPVIGLTLHGDLVPGMRSIKALLEEKGYETVIFAAVGSGGKTLEELIEQGLIDGVLDLATHEIACHLFGGMGDAGPDRLEAAGRKGIPQLIVPGKLDIISFNVGLGIPEKLKGRKPWMHNPIIGVIRLNKEEMTLVGKVVVEKLNKAIGPTAVIIPTRGLSDYGKGWEAFYDAEADSALFEVLRKGLKPEIRLVEVDAAINDRLFTEKAAALFDELMHQGG
jgi:uncharacterized protein (UPF0261 family)